MLYQLSVLEYIMDREHLQNLKLNDHLFLLLNTRDDLSELLYQYNLMLFYEKVLYKHELYTIHLYQMRKN